MSNFNSWTSSKKVQNELEITGSKLTSIENQLKKINPLRELNAYKSPPLETFNDFPGSGPMYRSVYLGIKHNPSYCDLVDMYNMYHSENVYSAMNFVGDYNPTSNTLF